MVDLVVDRRELKASIARALRFMGAAPAATSAGAAVMTEMPEPASTR